MLGRVHSLLGCCGAFLIIFVLAKKYPGSRLRAWCDYYCCLDGKIIQGQTVLIPGSLFFQKRLSSCMVCCVGVLCLLWGGWGNESSEGVLSPLGKKEENRALSQEVVVLKKKRDTLLQKSERGPKKKQDSLLSSKDLNSSEGSASGVVYGFSEGGDWLESPPFLLEI